MQRYIVIRIIQSILALLVLTVIVFSLARIAGDPLDVLLPLEATVEDAERVRAAWGLDRPVYIQYFKFLGNALTGDFGESIKHRDQQAINLVFRPPSGYGPVGRSGAGGGNGHRGAGGSALGCQEGHHLRLRG